MATKYCSYHNTEHPLEAFPQKNGKPHGTKCRQSRSEKGAKLAKEKKELLAKEQELTLSSEELELNAEAERIKSEVSDPEERKRLLVNLRQKRQRLKQIKEHKEGKAKKIIEKVCKGPLCKGAKISVEKFATQQYGDGYQTNCKECNKFINAKKSESYKDIDLENITKCCKNKECTCENPQPLTEFDKHVNYEFGRNDICKTCRQIERSKLNYSRQESGVKFCSGCDKHLDVSMFYSDKCNIDGLQSVCKTHQKKKINVSYSKYPNSIVHILNWAKQNAKNRDITFAITFQDIDELYLKQDGKCAITGIQMTHDYTKERKEDDSHIINKTNMSIDRIHNSKGYTKNNIQLVCAVVNRIKHDMNPFELMFFVTTVGNHTVRKQAVQLGIIKEQQTELTNEMIKRIEQKYKYTISNAKARNLDVNITHEDLNKLYVKQNGKCAITGQLLTCNKSLCDISIDRIDSNKYYDLDNVQLVLDSANQRKGDLSNNELENWTNTIRKSPLLLSQLTSI